SPQRPENLISVSSVLNVLEGELDRDLDLPRVAHTLPQKARKIEQRSGRERVHVVRVVEGVEHLDARNELIAPPEPERPLQPPIEREVLVVLAVPVAAAIGAVQDAGRRR